MDFGVHAEKFEIGTAFTVYMQGVEKGDPPLWTDVKEPSVDV